MCSNSNFAFLKLSHQPLKHQDLPENENKKEELNYWPKNLTESRATYSFFITYTYRRAILVIFFSICLLQASYYVF